jgi:hypothetical protein
MLAAWDIELEKLWIPALTALVVGALNYLQQNRAAKHDRRNARLTDQLQKLYGPLTFLLGENDYLLGVTQRREVGAMERAQAAALQIRSNNDAIRDLLKSNYAYMDTRDVAVFTQFAMDWQLHTFAAAGYAPPADRYAPLHRTQMLDCVANRFAELSGELTALTHGWLTRQVRGRQWVKLQDEDKPTKSP